MWRRLSVRFQTMMDFHDLAQENGESAGMSRCSMFNNCLTTWLRAWC